MSNKTTCQETNVIRRAFPSRTNTGWPLIWALTTCPSALATDAIHVNMTQTNRRFQFFAHRKMESKIARMTKCSIIHATHVLISGPRASQLKMELTKKLLAHVACERSTPLSVWSFLGPSALPIVYKSATYLPASPNIVVLP